MTTPQHLVWIDYEGTGVHEDGPVLPLELGLIVTDRAGNEIDTFQSRILIPGWRDAIKAAVPFVQTMHSQSGLIADLVRAEEHFDDDEAYKILSPERVEWEAVQWLRSIFPPSTNPEKLPMVGSTVHYDKRVAQEHMPKLHNWFHYRVMDISSIKNACKILNPDLYARLPKEEHKAHRPLADIRSSIREFQWYTNEFLITESW